MNTLHSYRRDYSHRWNERVGAKSENELHEAQANLTKIAEDLDQCSEEPKAKFLPRKASPGASKCLLFSIICNLCCNLFICAFKFSGVD